MRLISHQADILDLTISYLLKEMEVLAIADVIHYCFIPSSDGHITELALA